MPRTRSDTSRRAILDAAFELVGEVGYAKLTMEGIAARAGVGKQTIYRWWPSKGAVLFDAFLALSEDAEGVPALPDTGDLAADLKLVLRATVAELNDPRYDVPMRAMAAAIASDPALAAEYEQRLEAPMRAHQAHAPGERPRARAGHRPRARRRPALEPAARPLATAPRPHAGVRRRPRRRPSSPAYTPAASRRRGGCQNSPLCGSSSMTA